MSFSRLYQAHPELSYQSGLLNTIDLYLDTVKPKTAGHVRALALRTHILTTLACVEKLSDTQLMWRLFEYTFMQPGVGPLHTSKVLREKILQHLIRNLKISEKEIERMRDAFHAEDVRTFAASAAAANYVPDMARMLRSAQRSLIKKALSDKANNLAGNVTCDYLVSLFETIEIYKKLATEESWFKAEGLVRADQVSKTVSDWVMVEKLNDRQVLARLYEHLAMPLGQDNGLMGTSKQLRNEIAAGMCQYLQLDEKAIAEKVVVAVARSVHSVGAPGGGVVVADDPVALALKFRLEAIKTKLQEGTGVENIEIFERTGGEIEMRSFK